ncbi:MAG TPA: NADH-quinone oxidoreductase subunit M [Candidatus Eisenbacteria bacterium]|nr:NADH-quinone oxidoreductase subunit M [Candidatus Eisenbacteria bacterium]
MIGVLSRLGIPYLTLLVFFPLVGAAGVLLVPRARERMARSVAFAVATIEFLLSIPLFTRFEPRAGMQISEHAAWLPGIGASYHLGVDGISMLLVLLTTLLTALSVLSSFSAVTERPRAYYALLLLLETAMLGTFVALDLVVFYIFWEAMLVPMYFLIGVWGGERRIHAAIKFFLYTMAGSVLMLVAILWTYFLHHAATGVYSFDLLDWYRLPVPLGVQTWLFLAFALAFAIKVPLFPFHTWLPLAHVEAPTAGSVILAGVLLKMGTYGFLRFAIPLFPNAATLWMPLILGLAVIGIIYGALVAWVQPDVKKLVAYSSVSHLGFVMLGMLALNPEGLSGSLLQMINHGISTGALFLLVGVLYERRHTRLISDYGGIWKVMPMFAVVFLIIMLSSIALPGTNGFVGEFLILLGAFRAHRIFAVIAAVGVILSAVYMLFMFQRVMFGPVTHPENDALPDLRLREWAVFVPLLILVFWLGIYPAPFLTRVQPALADTAALIERRALMCRTVEAQAGRTVSIAPPTAPMPDSTGGRQP